MTQPLQKIQTVGFQTISPVDDSVYLERPFNDRADIDAALNRAKAAQKKWKKIPLKEKQAYLTKALEALLSKSGDIAEEITLQMGRPLSQSAGELRGLEERARYMIEIAPHALADMVPATKEGFKRYIKRVPLGVIAILAPWNYPYLTSVNGIFPALLAGNCVVLKHSHQTPLVADRYAEAFTVAGLPEGVFQTLDLTHDDAEFLMADSRVDFVNFTGSVKGGHAVQKAIADKFIPAGLELGGKDPAYVRADADLDYAVENLVDGAFFNSGQSCCGIERIYVHESLYDDFVAGFVTLTKQYRLGNPMKPETNLGPMVRTEAADFVRKEIAKALTQGAKSLIDESLFPDSKAGTPYLAPQVLVNVNHSMSIMTEENFGPVVGIMKVSSDEEAIALINDSEYGLTASLWTRDMAAGETLAQDVEAGTVFINRCDYLDPALAWTGVKNSGRGCTLSSIGFEHMTRPKSFHFKEC
ncbi:MAG: aldehyde dehydrogenase [Alphaproteobacteria bacterium CG_4_9_14_3_um_filter_47_13]|nr:MAG: aldehyde dehydrogenase [Alphaproteobacteria bacterium CG_4_9_14_3_um_filter_47_13]